MIEIKYSATSIEVITSDSDKFAADYAPCTFISAVLASDIVTLAHPTLASDIVTLAHPTLASDIVTFSSPHPEWKKGAIFKNSLTLYTQIFLIFPSKFWNYHEYILHAYEERGRFPVFQDMERPCILPNGSNILMFTVTGNEGRRIKRQAYNETNAEVIKTSREIFGQGVPDATGKDK